MSAKNRAKQDGRAKADAQRELAEITRRCSSAELLMLLMLRSEAQTEPEIDFLSKGYLVANASAAITKKHGRRKAHLANLINKGLIVALDRSRSRKQRYLVGCIYEESRYYASWLDEVFGWGRGIEFANLQASREASNRAMRPTRAETPQSLMDKGFVPLRPNRSSSYGLPVRADPSISASGASASRPSKRDTPVSGPVKRKSQSAQDRQIELLAGKLSRLSGVLPNTSGKSRAIWTQLVDFYGFDQMILIIAETWKHRHTLLNSDFPTLTVHNVIYYASRNCSKYEPLKSKSCSLGYDDIAKRVNLSAPLSSLRPYQIRSYTRVCNRTSRPTPRPRLF
jgi:hypothetical protein